MNLNRELSLNENIFNRFLEQGAIFSLNRKQSYIAFGNSTWTESVENIGEKPFFYAPDYYLETKTPWLSFESGGIVSNTELHNFLGQLLFCSENQKKRLWKEPSQQTFYDIYNKVLDLIKTEKTRKVVPVISAESAGAFTHYEKAKALHQSISLLKGRMLYGFWLQTENQGQIGVTPETLFSYNFKEKKMQTMALAGTHAITKGKGSLLSSSKDRQEHELVKEDLRKVINKWSSEIIISPTFEHNLNILKHLRTDFEFRWSKDIDNNSFLELITDFHPTAALGVYPRSHLWKELKYWEEELGVTRWRYGAPFGLYMANKYLSVIVSIRNIQWNKQKSVLASGCGLINESLFDNEWEELSLKRHSVKKFLGLELNDF